MEESFSFQLWDLKSFTKNVFPSLFTGFSFQLWDLKNKIE